MLGYYAFQRLSALTIENIFVKVEDAYLEFILLHFSLIFVMPLEECQSIFV
jgi:hypothetical protein